MVRLFGVRLERQILGHASFGELLTFLIESLIIRWLDREKENDDPIYPTPPLGQDMTQGQFLSGV